MTFYDDLYLINYDEVQSPILFIFVKDVSLAETKLRPFYFKIAFDSNYMVIETVINSEVEGQIDKLKTLSELKVGPNLKTKRTTITIKHPSYKVPDSLKIAFINLDHQETKTYSKFQSELMKAEACYSVSVNDSEFKKSIQIFIQDEILRLNAFMTDSFCPPSKKDKSMIVIKYLEDQSKRQEVQKS